MDAPFDLCPKMNSQIGFGGDLAIWRIFLSYMHIENFRPLYSFNMVMPKPILDTMHHTTHHLPHLMELHHRVITMLEKQSTSIIIIITMLLLNPVIIHLSQVIIHQNQVTMHLLIIHQLHLIIGLLMMLIIMHQIIIMVRGHL